MRKNDASRQRRVKRDLSTIPRKGVAGLRLDGLSSTSSNETATATTNTGFITDEAVRIASDIIDSTLAHSSDQHDESEESDDNNGGVGGERRLSRDIFEHADQLLDLTNSNLVGNGNCSNSTFTQTFNDFRLLTLGGHDSSDSDRNGDEDDDDDDDPGQIIL